MLNDYLSTFGGGEKNCYAMADSLAGAGHQVDVLTFDERVPTLQQIEAFYGPGHSRFRIVSLRGSDEKSRAARLTEILRDYPIFINHSANSSFPNPCPLGIYLVMFPFNPPSAFLSTYRHYLCISDFTRFYTEQRWGKNLATTLLHPCCDAFALPRDEKNLSILSIGRFNWSGHQKNHAALVDAFEQIATKLPEGTTLTLLGKLNDEQPAARDNLEKLQRRSEKLPVVFEVNVSEQRKTQLLSRASIFWHGAGLGMSEPFQASSLEHFGIAVLEAMGAGAIPLCYHRGGPREILEQGKSGFAYRDLDELGAYTLLLATDLELRKQMSANAVERAKLFSRAAFDERLSAFFNDAVST